MTARMVQRCTPGAPVTVEGLGLFTDRPSSCTIAPGERGAGIVFRHRGVEIPATIAHLGESPILGLAGRPARHTCLVVGTERVLTCEHLLSALFGLGISDALVTLGESGEPPIGDGSSLHFAQALTSVGVRSVGEPMAPLTLASPITVAQGDAEITAEPADTPSYAYHFDPSASSPLLAQSAYWNGSPEDYSANIAPARTFSTQSEANQAKSLGLFTSFTTKDLLVLENATGRPIENALRFDNEPARHKLLDLIGDLALVGRPICARFTARRSGHALNHEMARRLARMI